MPDRTTGPEREQHGAASGNQAPPPAAHPPPHAQATAAQFQFFQSILDSMGDGLVVADATGRLLLFNPAAERIIGIGLVDVAPDEWGRVYGVFHPDRVTPYPTEQMPLARAIRGEACNQVELFIRNVARPQGVFISVTGQPLRDAQGQPCGGVVVFRDITEQKVAEEQLAYKRSLLQALMDHMPDYIYFKDAESRFTRINRALANRFWLVDPAEAIGKTDFDFFTEEHARQAYEDEQAVLHTGRPIISKEEKETWPTGDVTWVSTTKMPLRDEAGRILGTFGLSRDITARKHAEEELRKSRERFALAVAGSKDGIWDWDVQTNEVYLSPRWKSMLGYEDHELANRFDTWERLLHPDDRARALATIRDYFEGRTRDYELEHRLLCKDGSYRWILARGAALRDGTGRPYRMAGSHTDITDRKKSEEALRNSEERTRAVVDNVLDALVTINEHGTVEAFNPAAERIFGYRAALVVGHNVKLLMPESYRGRHDAGLARCMHTGRSQLIGRMVELVGRRQDGSEFPLELSLGEFRLGQRRYFTGIIRDITERKRAEEELRRAYEAAEAASQAKSQFLANVSHEIRTPMNGILGMTALALTTDLTPEQREYLTLVKSSGEALLTVINDVLDFSKIEAGKLDIDPISFGLRDLLGDAMKSLALRAHAKGLEVAWHVADDVPDWVTGDAMRLRQVIVNLVGNAVKFTEQGEVVVTVGTASGGWGHPQSGSAPGGSTNRGVHTPRSPELLHFAIRDTGIGISAEKQRAIFAPFVQGDGSMSRRYGGTGLGLSISSRLVELMGGRLGLESEPGKGTTFHFTLPLPPSQEPRPEPAPGRTLSLRGLRVLIVDDNATNRRILVDMTRHWGLEPVAVESGPEAIEQMRRACAAGVPFPVVLLDARMPGMDGFALAEQIQRQPELAGPVVMMLTSTDRQGDAARCRNLGITAYLTKPFKPSELLDAIVGALGAGAAGGPSDGWGHPPSGSAAPSGGFGSLSAMAPLRVLVAEDHPVNQTLLRCLLDRQGHKMVLAGNGREAVKAFQTQAFDVVLMDVSMPEMDGFEATAQIRRLEADAGGGAPAPAGRTPIIAMTAHAMKGDRERCLAAGMDGYLAKPLAAAELWQALAKIADCRLKIVDLKTGQVAEPASSNLKSQISNLKSPAVDWQAALACVGGDVELLRALAELFRAEAPRLREGIRQAIQHQNAAVLRLLAHTLRSAAGNLGGVGVATIARELEQIGQGGDLAEAAAAFARLEDSLTRMDAELNELELRVEKGR